MSVDHTCNEALPDSGAAIDSAPDVARDVLIGDHRVEISTIKSLLDYDAQVAAHVETDAFVRDQLDSEAAAFDDPSLLDATSGRRSEITAQRRVRSRHAGDKPSLFTAESTARSRSTIELQGYVSLPYSAPQELSRDILSEIPDYYSAYDVAPQPDGGEGVVAIAEAYVRRHTMKTAGADEIPGSSISSRTKNVVWAYSHHGHDLRDFLTAVRDRDPFLATHTKAVLACDSEQKRDAIKNSDLLKDWEVDYRLIVPEDPSTIQIPQNTRVALMADTLDKLPAHQVFKHNKTGVITEIVGNVTIAENEPLLLADGRTRQSVAYDPMALRINETLYGNERIDLVSQLYGRLGQTIEFRPLNQTTLDTQEMSTETFVANQNPNLRDKGVVFNYAPTVEPLLETVLSGLSEDGLAYVSGLNRTDRWLHPDALQVSDGPVLSNVLEMQSIQAAATMRAIAPEAVHVRSGAPGEHGSIIIDCSKDPIAIATAQEDFDGALDALRAPVIVEARAALETARTQLRSGDQATRIAGSQRLQQAYDELVRLSPQSGRDPTLTLELARDCHQVGIYEFAYDFAEKAFAAAPNMSAGLIEMARAVSEFDAGNYTRSQELLDRLQKMTTANSHAHDIVRQNFDSHPASKAQNYADYRKATAEYLRTTVEHDPQKMLPLLVALSETLQTEWQEAAASGQSQPDKTIIIENLETGSLREHHISEAELKRIITADAALANAETIGKLYDASGVGNETLQAAQDTLFRIWQTAVPRDTQTGLPLVRDEWADRNPNRKERWLYSGSLYVVDSAAPLSQDLRTRLERQRNSSRVEVSTLSHSKEYPMQTLAQLSVGRVLDDLGHEGKQTDITREDMTGHMLITGQSRKGKTTLLKTMFEQLPAMDINFWGFDLGNKSELAGLAAQLSAQGIPVTVIAPGDVNKIPVSINFLRPVEGTNIEEHIGKVVEAWITAYGGGGDSPVTPTLTGALREIYAANGWSVTPGEDEVLPTSQTAIPVTPTLSELLAACERRASAYAKGTDAGNLPVYFKTRIDAMQRGAFGDFLSDGNSMDWAKLDRSNVIFDFSRITDPDQRRFMFTALTMQASNYLQFHKGLNNKVNTVWAIDEASLIAKNSAQSSTSRQHAVELFAERQKVIGGYGVSIWNAMQSLKDVHPDFISQSTTTIALPLGDAQDKQHILSAMNVQANTELYTELFKLLSASEAGTALISKSASAEPVRIRVTQPETLDAQQLARITHAEADLPIIPNPYSGYTYGQHKAAKEAARFDEQAWKRIYIGAVTLAHVAHTPLPKAIPEPLARQWQQEYKADPAHARLLTYYIAKQAVHERARAVKAAYDPRELTASVVAETIGSLQESDQVVRADARYASPNFGVPQLRQALTYKRLTRPLYGSRPPRPRQFVRPLEYRLEPPTESVTAKPKRPVAPGRYPTAREQIEALERHYFSPANKSSDAAVVGKNNEQAYVALVGEVGDGAALWRAMRMASGNELDAVRQRRLIAAALGYLSSNYATDVSEYEENLALATDLYRRQQQLVTAS
jgi:hypothetical protein